MTWDEATLGQLNLIEFTREDVRWQQPHHIVERDGVLLFAGASDFVAFSNGVRRTDDRTPGEQVVAMAIDFFAPYRRGWSLWTRTLSVDDDLAAAAESTGLAVFGNGAPQMICRAPLATEPLPARVTIDAIDAVDDRAAVDEFARISGEAYVALGAAADVTASHFGGPMALRDPNTHAVLARLDGEPVGASLILLSHGIAGVYWVGVLEQARGHGIAAAMMRHITNLAFELGAANVQLQASVMGEPIYRRLGYEDLYRYRLHLAMPPS